jgi:hypothetical protein
MPRMTWADVLAHQAKFNRKVPVDSESEPFCGPESELQQLIRKECERRRWIVLSSRMDRRTGRRLGEWDMVILADRGRTYLVEAKVKGGKISPAQHAMGHHARYLGHHAAVVYSLDEFIEFIRPEQDFMSEALNSGDGTYKP